MHSQPQRSSQLHKMILVFLGGLSNGLPGVLTWQTLGVWLDQLGYSKTLLTTIFITGIPYSLKFLLAPVVDHVKIPYLWKSHGQRCSWAIIMQLIMLLSLVAIGIFTKKGSLLITAFFCFVTSLCSSMNQIATVSHRIEILDTEGSAKGVAVGILGYRVGKLIGTGGAYYLMTFLPWSVIYSTLALLLLFSISIYILTPERSQELSSKSPYHPKLIRFFKKKYPNIFSSLILKHLFCTITIPFLHFSRNNAAWKKILLLLLLINVGDDLVLGVMDLFYLNLGFTPLQVLKITKIFGLCCSLVGGFFAALLYQKQDTITILIQATIAHAISQLILISLSLKGPDPSLLMISIMAEYFTSGMKAALIATLISNLCSGIRHTGTQYAFFSSIKSLPLTFLSSMSGFIIDRSSWPFFFCLSFVLSIPALILLASIYLESRKTSSYHKVKVVRLRQKIIPNM